MNVNLVNPTTKQVKQVKVGFSWTVFFWGFFPPLFRGDWKWFAVILALDIFTAGFGAPVVSLVFSFIYNKLYINDLIANGYKPAEEASRSILVNNGFITAE